MNASARFWAKVVKGPDCWIWTGARNPAGYGNFHPVWNRVASAHRYAYELMVGVIPAGLTLDHLCRNPSCVNPDHLEPATMRENIMRGTGPSAVNAAKSHCSQGHPFSYFHDDKRYCLICRAATERRRRARRKAQEVPA